jgi:uncharacterized ParB-like nuclease family protein
MVDVDDVEVEGEEQDEEQFDSESEEAPERNSKLEELNVGQIPLEQLRPNPWNPNEMDDAAFNRLAEELQDVGMIDPIQVVPMEDGLYRIIGGEHRYQVARTLGWKTLPCVVLSEARWKDEDLQKLVTVRLNVLRGKINPERMVSPYFDAISS